MSPKEALDLNAMRETYVSQGFLTPEQFAELVEGTRKINALGLGDFHWHLTYLARDMHGHIPWSTHLQAWAAALRQPYQGIEDFYRRAIEGGVFAPWILNQTQIHAPPPDPTKFQIGRLLVRFGLITISDLQRAIGIQQLIRQETGLPSRIGRVLSAIAPISVIDGARTIALQMGLPYVSLDQSFGVIERAVAKS